MLGYVEIQDSEMQREVVKPSPLLDCSLLLHPGCSPRLLWKSNLR